ncbi:MAG: hypothetical protein LBV47_03080 [Bacteroidales bacterium]|nr:hypothetical protein [Bacteroidales bacterium]
MLKFVGTDYTTQQKNDIKTEWMNYYNNRITFEAEATYKYNCHVWAWAGFNNYWMNAPEQAKYWNDGSYTEVTTPFDGAKVRYVSDDHSSVATSTSDYFSSKWGPGPRFKHHKNDSPYTVTSLKYYARVPYISGLANIKYPGSVTAYTLDNARPGTITWEKSAGSPFNISPTTGSTTNVTQTGSSGTGTLTAKINGVVVATKTITASKITISGVMNGPDVVYKGQTGVSYWVPFETDLTYNWEYGYFTLASSNGFSSCSFNVPQSFGIGSEEVLRCVVKFNGATVGAFYKHVEIY